MMGCYGKTVGCYGKTVYCYGKTVGCYGKTVGCYDSTPLSSILCRPIAMRPLSCYHYMRESTARP
jgi:hypothetical protein